MAVSGYLRPQRRYGKTAPGTKWGTRAKKARPKTEKQRRGGVGWGGGRGQNLGVLFARRHPAAHVDDPPQPSRLYPKIFFLNHLRSEKQIIYISLQILLGLKQIIEMQSEHKCAPDSKEEEAMEKLTAP